MHYFAQQWWHLCSLHVAHHQTGQQYDFIRQVCSNGEASAENQYASFWQATPGEWCLSSTWKGQTITIPGPQSFYWGGTGLAATTACSDKELAADIIKYFTCDTESMEKIAQFNCDYINNAEANAYLLANAETIITNEEENLTLASGNGLMNSQNYVEVYADILKNTKIDTSVVKAEDKQINDNLSTYVIEYIDGASYEDASADLVGYIHDTFSYLNVAE